MKRSTRKDQDAASHGKLWGPTLNGIEGRVGVARGHRLRLACATLALLREKRAGRTYAATVGQWSAILQFCRPGDAVFQSIYPFLEKIGLHQNQLPPLSVQEELVMMS